MGLSGEAGVGCTMDGTVTVSDGRFTATGYSLDTGLCHSISMVTIKPVQAGGPIDQRPVDPLPPPPPEELHPVDPIAPTFAGNAIPMDCVSWNDGCNTCGVTKGRTTMCTMMACFRQGTPYCQAFQDGTTCSDPDCSAKHAQAASGGGVACLLYTSPSPRD